jgi:hypothetical protein
MEGGISNEVLMSAAQALGDKRDLLKRERVLFELICFIQPLFKCKRLSTVMRRRISERTRRGYFRM